MLRNFCNDIYGGSDLTAAYKNYYSANLQSQITLDQFDQEWSPSSGAISNCNYEILSLHENRAKVVILTTAETATSSGITTQNQTYNVTVFEVDSDVWVIDSVQQK